MHISSRNCRNERQFLSIIHNTAYRQMRGKRVSALLYLSSDDFAGICCATKKEFICLFLYIIQRLITDEKKKYHTFLLLIGTGILLFREE
jgi:hypothetical protein